MSTKQTVPQAALVLARRQYIPIQKGAANVTGMTHEDLSRSNTLFAFHDQMTAPMITMALVIHRLLDIIFQMHLD